MEPEVDRVLSEVMFQASEVGDDTVPEVSTHSGFRCLVKIDGGLDIAGSFLEDGDPPDYPCRSLVCNSSTVGELASPEAIRAARCSRMLRCHSGEGQSMPSLAKDTQTLSITLKRSAGDIREISSAANMKETYATPDRSSSGYFGDTAPGKLEEPPKMICLGSHSAYDRDLGSPQWRNRRDARAPFRVAMMSGSRGRWRDCGGAEGLATGLGRFAGGRCLRGWSSRTARSDRPLPGEAIPLRLQRGAQMVEPVMRDWRRGPWSWQSWSRGARGSS